MDIILSFINELHTRITNVYSQNEQIDNQKNSILEIENIFLKYRIQKTNLTGENLMQISSDDFQKVLELMEVMNIDKELSSFTSSIKIINLYNESKKTLLYDPEQFEYAKNHLDLVAKNISNYLQDFNKTNEDRIKSLLNTIDIPQKILAKFNNGVLIDSIIKTGDLEQLISLFKSFGYNEEETAKFLAEIGKNNYRLFFPQQKTKAEKIDIPEITNFQGLLYSKQKLYIDAIEKLKHETVSYPIEKKVLETLSKKHELSIEEVRNAVICIVIKRLIDKFNSVLVQDDNHTMEDQKELDNIFQILEKVEKYNEQYGEDNLDANLINQINNILKKEEVLLSRINQEELNRYIDINFEVAGADESSILNYRIAAVVIALRVNLDELQGIIRLTGIGNILENPSRNEKVGIINNFLETYNLLVNQRGIINEKNQKIKQQKVDSKITKKVI